MHKVYLTTTLPATSSISPKLAPDVHMALREYNSEQKTYGNEAPKIRPQHFEKYDVAKEKEIIPLDERDGEINYIKETQAGDEEEISESVMENAINSLPVAYRRRGARLLPFIQRINLHGQRLPDVLYDLTAVAKKVKVQNREAMEAIIRQLDNLHDLPSSFYLRKGVPTPGEMGVRSAKRTVDGTPTARALKTPSTGATFFTPQRTERQWY